ncbi:MAG: glycosyltransferase [Lachnospiraceae bacterium]|nr:glycosyltransferase [Lachnospiraceae bacterium]
MIKVCHMTSAHRSDDVRIFQKECVSLAAAGYEVYLVARGESREERGVHVIGVGEPKPGRFNRIFHFTKTIYRTAVSLDADIYHFHDPELLLYAMKLKRRGKAVIFDSHEHYVRQIAVKSYFSPLVAKMVAKIYGVFEGFVLRRIDGVVFPCRIDGKNPFEGKAKKTVFLDNYPRLDEFYEHYDPDKKRNDYDACYIGSLAKTRGITEYVKAAAAEGIKLALAGSFNSATYKQEVLSMSEFKAIDYFGQLDRSAVFDLINRSSIGLNVLHNIGQYANPNNLSTKVYEYMALGKPVVLNDAPYNREMVNKYGFGICVDPADPDALAAGIRELLQDPQFCEQCGQNGRNAVRDRFNWDSNFEDLLEFYSELCIVK